MGMDPKTILVASIRPPNGQPDEFLETNFPDYESEGEIRLVPGSENYEDRYSLSNYEVETDKESFDIHEYATYGWGEFVTLDELVEILNKFEEKVVHFCNVYGCTYSINVGATFD